jgi:hypothetical protein
MSTVEEAKRIEQLQAEARRLGIPVWQLEAARSVPSDLIRDIVADSRNASGPSSIAASPSQAVGERGTGWAKDTPLAPPPGVAILDKIMDVQDAFDRREREKQLKG